MPFRSLKRIFSKLKLRSRPKRNISPTDRLDNDLTFAAEQGDIRNVRRLLTESAAQRRKHDKRVINAYFSAAASNKADVVVMLIKEYGVQPDVKKSVQGKTALEHAVRAGHGWTTRLLIENGADPFRGRPSPYDVAQELWQYRALEMLKDKIKQVRPDEVGKLGSSRVKREEDYIEKELEREHMAKELERRKKFKKEEDYESRERKSSEIWPDRVFARGRGVVAPSEPAYWD